MIPAFEEYMFAEVRESESSGNFCHCQKGLLISMSLLNDLADTPLFYAC